MSVYLVIEPIGIIANDLEMSIRDFDPDADVVLAASADQAEVELAGREAVHVAFVHMDPDAFAKGSLAVHLAGSGTVCVFMGDAAERGRKEAVLVLERPFSSATVGNLLDAIAPSPEPRA